VKDGWLHKTIRGNSQNSTVWYNIGDYIDNSNYAIRPALKFDLINLPIGETFIALGNRWVMIDDGFAISQDVITHRLYDSNSNEWETSELKVWLEEWAKKGEEDGIS